MCAEGDYGICGALSGASASLHEALNAYDRLCSLIGYTGAFDSPHHRVITLLLAAEMEEHP